MPTTQGEHELFVGKHGIRRLQLAACGEPGFHYWPIDRFKLVTNVTLHKEEYHRLFVISFTATASRQAQAVGAVAACAKPATDPTILTAAKTRRMVNQGPPDGRSILQSALVWQVQRIAKFKQMHDLPDVIFVDACAMV